MAKMWDLSDTSKHWDIERQLKAMLSGGKVRMYNGVYPDSVEDVYISPDGTAEVNLYGRDENDVKGHYHFKLMLKENGDYDIINCHKN